jgi:uncharacterized protein DUF5996
MTALEERHYASTTSTVKCISGSSLHLDGWRATKDTLHLYAQIVGKIRLVTTPSRNHWWNVPLYVDVRGLTTRRLHHLGATFEISFDFVDHTLVVQTGDGRARSFELADGVPVAEFDARLHQPVRPCRICRVGEELAH